RGLMRQIRSDVAVQQNNLAVVQRRFQFRLGFVAIAGVEQGGKVRIDGFQRAKVTIQKLPDHSAKPGFVLRETRRINRMALRAQRVGQEFDLRALAAAVDSLEGDQPAERPFVDWWL